MRTITKRAARAMTSRAARDQLARRNKDQLPDGIGGTITGGPMEPINLLEILERGARGVSRGGAVSGAAQVMVSSLGRSGARDRGIALSDGSRISFASVADAGVLKEDDATVLRDNEAHVPRNDNARVPDKRHTRVLTSV